MADLKPCPFCGGKARIVIKKEYRQDYSFEEKKHRSKYRCQVICNKCYSRGKPVKFFSWKWGDFWNVPYLEQKADIQPWLDLAAEYWNRREKDE